MTTNRRQFCQTGVSALGVLALSACKTQPESYETARQRAIEAMSPEDQALAKRFAVLRGGGQLVVDSLFHALGVNIFDADGRYIFSKASVRLGSETYVSYRAPLGVPKAIRVEWRTEEGMRSERYRPASIWTGGKILGDYSVPVASRIPEALLEDLRQNRGSFRLKIRLHPKGVLIGWDIERRPGFDPKKRDQFGQAVYVALEHSFFGGDFREARIYNGKPVRKGWYIDPQTKKRFETDY